MNLALLTFPNVTLFVDKDGETEGVALNTSGSKPKLI